MMTRNVKVGVWCLAMVLALPVTGCGDEQENHKVARTALRAGYRCFGLPPTIYVHHGRVVGGAQDGQSYAGRLSGTSGPDVVVGTNGRDFVSNIDADDVVCVRGGDDVVEGNRGGRVRLGAGDDRYLGQGTVWAGTGNDSLNIRGSHNRVYGGGGDDTIVVGPLEGIDNLVWAGSGNDHVTSSDADVTTWLGAGDDVFLGDSRGEHIVRGGPGDDIIRTDNAVAWGGGGNDEMTAAAGGVEFYGGNGDDVLSGGALPDQLDGGRGFDTADGKGGDDVCIRVENAVSCETILR